MQELDLFTDQNFGGQTYDADIDQVRLNAQASRVWYLVRDGKWRTLRQISDATGDPEASVSARLRDFRKAAFGGHVVKRRRLTEDGGTWVYRVLPNEDCQIEMSL
jgi:hypothetical protein